MNMNITRPQPSKAPLRVDDFSSYAQGCLLEELPLHEIESSAQRIEDAEFSEIEIRKSVFQNCTFQKCSFEKASFVDVTFQSCDLSNSKFAGAYFERCRFVSCKCIGIDMIDTVVKQTTFEQSNCRYSNFDKTKMTDVLFDHTDFTEASMAEAKLKRFEASGSRFIKNNFFKTMLATIDFTDNEFTMPIVSSPPAELKGVVINMFQAADLIGIWGVIVNRQ